MADAAGGSIAVTGSIADAAEEADVLYTDVWTSMGQEEEAEQRRRDFAGFCIDAAVLGHASERAVVMHSLPAHRGEEITDEVLEGPQSVVFDQAENRLHAERALLHLLLG
jgi:ornithine carbamoyltransferase